MPDSPTPPAEANSPPVELSYASPTLPNHGPKLARTMGLVSLTIYGVGDMLGAGIYALVGKAAGMMGNAVWLAFLGSMVAALLTGLSYANIGSRYPRAAGAAFVTHRAYGLPLLSYVIGLAVTASGLTSMATGSRAIGAAAQKLGLNAPVELIAVGFLVLLAVIVFRGIRESTWMNFLCTAVEVGGLAIVIFVGLRYWGSVDYLQGPLGKPAADGVATFEALTTMMVLQGAVLTFFSFIGFEDILNVSEEVKNPRRNVPLGILFAIVIATLIYMSVAITAVSVLTPAELGASKNALQDVVARAAPWFPAFLFGGISIFAIANTGLLNYVMGSRMLYGMSRQGLLPAALGRVHARRHTPHVAIGILLIVVLTLALSGDVRQLADATGLLLLSVFVVVNAALVVLKFRKDEPRPKGSFEVPWIIPVLGAAVCATLVISRLTDLDGESWKAPATAGAILAVILVLYAILRPKDVVPAELGPEDESH